MDAGGTQTVTSFLGHRARRLAKALQRVEYYFSRLAGILEGLLPALLSPAELSRLTREQYFPDYASKHFTTIDLTTLHSEQDTLNSWEHEVLTRYGLRTGRMLVMGAGTGREAIGIARRGLSVVGIDSSFAALGIARRLAGSRGLPIQVNQGDYMALPYTSGGFDYALLSSTMYSAIPGRAGRQAWLQELARVLAPGGLAIISFLPEPSTPDRVQALCGRLNRVLVKLPGANRAYQPGDNCAGDHFLHTFQSEKEVRGELAGAGAIIRELAWSRGYAVVAFPVEHQR
jgi:ubiquinone/menaquinone biosynthesis C-methylase UbiE